MSWIEDHLPDKLKDVLCEADEPVTPRPVLPTNLPPVQFGPVTPSIVKFPVSADVVSKAMRISMSAAVNSILSDLREKTDFDTTTIGKELKNALDALADTGMSAEQMAKTAMKITHLSPSLVISVIQGLQGVLDADKKQFNAAMDKANATEVAARQEKSTQLQSQIDEAEARLTSIRQEKQQVDSTLQAMKDKISSANANYAAALEARRTELAEMVSHYQSIPEVK